MTLTEEHREVLVDLCYRALTNRMRMNAAVESISSMVKHPFAKGKLKSTIESLASSAGTQDPGDVIRELVRQLINMEIDYEQSVSAEKRNSETEASVVHNDGS